MPPVAMPKNRRCCATAVVAMATVVESRNSDLIDSHCRLTSASVSELDQGAQQNAALAEQSAAAAQSLQDQAQRLKTLVERFRLEGSPA